MQYEFRRIGDGSQGILRETGRALTPFGGLVTLVELLRQLDFLGTVRACLPFRYRGHPRGQGLTLDRRVADGNSA